MPAHFDWHAEDDDSWDEKIYVSTDDIDSPRRRRRWYALSAIVIVLLLTLLVWRQLRGYVSDTAEATEADVLSSHELVSAAVTGADPELLVGLLSGRDPAWTGTQLSLLEQGIFFDRPSLKLAWQPPALDQNLPISVTLSADLQSAELVVQQPYLLSSSEELISLQQTLIYRLGDTRWLLAPPEEPFWGDSVVSNGRYISLTYPERDQTVGRRLAADLEALVGSACSTLELSCPDDLHLEIELTTDPAVWLAENDTENGLAGGRELKLPTPTLVGRPTNVAGYRALYWGYGDRVLTTLISDLVGYDCCQQALFYRALLDKQLQELGLGSWLVTDDLYRQNLSQPATLGQLEPLWQIEDLDVASGDPDSWLAYAVVDFLIQNQNGRQPLIEMQRQLLDADSIYEWAWALFPNGMSVDQAWSQFLQQQLIAAQTTPPVAFPEQDIALMCNNGVRGIANLYRLNLATGQWSFEIADRDFVVMMPLSDSRSMLLVEQFLSFDLLSPILWQDGREVAITLGDTFYTPAGPLDPTGRYLPVNIIPPEPSIYGLLDMSACEPEDCPILPLPGNPIWSPGGQHTLLEADDLLLLGDSRGQATVEIGPFREPVWLNDENFGYWSDEDTSQFLVTDINSARGVSGSPTGRPEALFEQADLLSALSSVITDTDQLDNYSIAHVTSSYQNPGQLLVVLDLFPDQDRPFLARFDWQSGEVVVDQITRPPFIPPPGGLGAAGTVMRNLRPDSFSPDGRWLTLTASGPATSSFHPGTMVVYDTVTGQSQTIVDQERHAFSLFGGWSADSQWYLRLTDWALIITAPTENYQHLLAYPFTNCTMAGWISSLPADPSQPDGPSLEIEGALSLLK